MDADHPRASGSNRQRQEAYAAQTSMSSMRDVSISSLTMHEAATVDEMNGGQGIGRSRGFSGLWILNR
jgi:hypothetical protein